MAIDGPVIHRDEDNPDLVHLYLMSYERHLLVSHFKLSIPRQDDTAIRQATSINAEDSQR